MDVIQYEYCQQNVRRCSCARAHTCAGTYTHTHAHTHTHTK